MKANQLDEIIPRFKDGQRLRREDAKYLIEIAKEARAYLESMDPLHLGKLMMAVTGTRDSTYDLGNIRSFLLSLTVDAE